MAEAVLKDQDPFSCPICLDLMKDPVAIPCGHSYCMGCITGCWDQDDQKGVYSCPQCRQTFTPRPVLYKNALIAEMVEKLKKTGLQAASPALCNAGPGDVECDVCTGKKHKAIKSCLVCLASYCQTHFKLHNDLNPGKKHKNKLGETQRKSQQRIQEREKELQELRKAVKSLRSSAQAAVENSERVFTELIRSIERRRSEVKELIRAQEKAELSQAEGILKQLEQEIDELRGRDAELEQFSRTEDHIHFLQSFQSVYCVPPGSEDLPSITVNPDGFEDVKKLVSEFKEQLEDFLQQEIMKISGEVTKVQIVPFPEPKTREEFLKYSCQLTLDPNTAHKHLCLSEGNRKVTYSKLQSYPDHPERFDVKEQVLCRESVSGRCYWEAEVRGWVDIAVSYKGISRKGDGNNCWFGYNDQSWSLFCSDPGYYFTHNNKATNITAPSSSRIGVYLDHRAGILSFYSVSDVMTLLHRVQTTFTQPLYPGFKAVVHRGNTVKRESSVKVSHI